LRASTVPNCADAALKTVGTADTFAEHHVHTPTSPARLIDNVSGRAAAMLVTAEQRWWSHCRYTPSTPERSSSTRDASSTDWNDACVKMGACAQQRRPETGWWRQDSARRGEWARGRHTRTHLCPRRRDKSTVGVQRRGNEVRLVL
jgi:hypothetical protein